MINEKWTLFIQVEIVLVFSESHHQDISQTAVQEIKGIIVRQWSKFGLGQQTFQLQFELKQTYASDFST